MTVPPAEYADAPRTASRDAEMRPPHDPSATPTLSPRSRRRAAHRTAHDVNCASITAAESLAATFGAPARITTTTGRTVDGEAATCRAHDLGRRVARFV